MTSPPSQTAEAGAVVPAAADGEEQAVVAGEVDGGDHVAGVGAAGDQRRPPVDHRVVDGARSVVVGIPGRMTSPRMVPMRCWIASSDRFGEWVMVAAVMVLLLYACLD